MAPEISEIFDLVVGETGDFAESEYVDEDDVAINIAGFSFELRVNQPTGIIVFAGSITSEPLGTFNFNRDGTKFIEGRFDSVLRVDNGLGDVKYATNMIFDVADNLTP